MEEDPAPPEEHSMSSADLQDEFQPVVKLEEDEIFVQIKEEEIPTEISADPRDATLNPEERHYTEGFEATDLPEGRLQGHALHKKSLRKSSRWDISLEQLISMVHQRPEIWDTECPRYSDRYRKKKVWDELCATLTPDWPILSERQKKQRAKDIQTRWRSARDRYRRDLNERQGKSSPGGHKKKPYVFFKDLNFLKRSMEMREKSKNANADDSDDDLSETPRTSNFDNDSLETVEVPEADEVPPPSPPPPQVVKSQILPVPPPVVTPASRKAAELPESLPKVSQTYAPSKKRKASRQPDDFEAKILDMMAAMQDKQRRFQEEQREILAEGPAEVDLFQNVNDDDVAFLRSLLPYFKRAPASRKLDLRIGVLNVVSQFVDSSAYEDSPPLSAADMQYSDHSGAFLASQAAPSVRYGRGNAPPNSSSYSHVSSTSASYQNPQAGPHGEAPYAYSASSPSPRPYMQDL